MFAHHAQQQLALHQFKAQDLLFFEMQVEYEDYLRKADELNLEKTPEYQAIVEDQKNAIRAILTSQASEEVPEADEANAGKTVTEKKND